MKGQGHVSTHALSAGYLTLPEAFFVKPLDDPLARKTVPSLSFLVQHVDPTTLTTTRIVFDLGIRRRLSDYAAPIYKHAMTRQPLSGDNDAVSSLAKGGLSPNDIDIVMFSHLHWDHIGTPSDFPSSSYVVGPGAGGLIDGSRGSEIGSHNHFEQGLLDPKRLIELPQIGGWTPPPVDETRAHQLAPQTSEIKKLFAKPWGRNSIFDATLDVFGDGSLYVVSAPGHLDGHINLLCRKESGDYVYLAGDSCHDRRLLQGTKDIATWSDPEFPGYVCCIHKDKAAAEKTLAKIRSVMSGGSELGNVEVIFTHDLAWEQEALSKGRFFPGTI
jgi:glyoxylase-like metal-dependent hydrolase (beta-lactamase superfamily II)